jgi:hypothetical protein
MPILRQRDMLKTLGEAIDDRHDGIAVGHRERAARAEIHLHINNQQQIIFTDPDLHFGPALSLIAKL